jgi:hypothetical protein
MKYPSCFNVSFNKTYDLKIVNYDLILNFQLDYENICLIKFWKNYVNY